MACIVTTTKMPPKIDPAVKAAAQAEKEAKKAEREAKKAVKAAAQAVKAAATATKKALKEAAAAAKKAPPAVEDIQLFYEKSDRGKNDVTNKKREKILPFLECIPADYIGHPVYGTKWVNVHSKWKIAVRKVAEKLHIPTDTPYTLRQKGGRLKYDLELLFEGHIPVKVEFKYGCKNINTLPQFLTLYVPTATIIESQKYHHYYYDNYLDKYRACDSGITVPTPTWGEYAVAVKNDSSSKLPFFKQLREREEFNKTEKTKVVHDSISAYLKEGDLKINVDAFAATAKTTQNGKIYFLWCDDDFHLDEFRDSDFVGITFKGIRNENIIDLVAANETTIYSLLLRWKNHNGILVPAWQISVRR
jgi:hypothetical protein